MLPGHVPSVVAGLTPIGLLSATNHLYLAIGLPVRNQAALDELLRQLYDPRSTNFHKFLTPPEFTARFGPTEQDYQAVTRFVETNGLAVTGTHGNRVVLDVEGSVSNVEHAFNVTLRTYRHPTEARNFFAPDTEPSVPADLSVVTVEGLSDYAPPRPLTRKADALKAKPLSFNGSGPYGEYAGNDFRNAYVPGTTLNGAGQSVGLLEFSAYYPVDITNYENIIGLTSYVSVTNVVIGRRAPGTANNDEVALDIEMVIAMAPGLSRVIVYEESSVSPSTILSRMADDNLARQLSSSWTWSGGPTNTIDAIFQQMATQGQSFFQASGDNDAYTGSETLDNPSQTTAPVDSSYVTSVGGTTLTMNGTGASWSSETVWNYNLSGIPNEGSGGGISAYYPIPYWQTNVSMAANAGSTTYRNIPDVALTADNVFVSYNNGNVSGTNYFMGTSCAAPLWAGFCALVNQQYFAVYGTNVGFLNPALYAIAGGTNYNACFHDITTGNNIGANTPGLFYAVAGYDLCTGLGTPNGTNLINALAPLGWPYFLTQPSSQTVTNGASVTFSATASGPSPLSYQWLFNGANLPAGANISGTTSNVLSLTAVTTNASGNYSLIVANSYGSVTSRVAVLNVGFAPAFSAQPADLIILSGSNAVLSATVSGSIPLVYQWRKNGTNLVNGSGISGATSNSLTLTAVTTNSSGNYNLSVTNSFGAITSSNATLTIVLPPTITGSSLTNGTVQCGSNNVAFAVTVTGTAPLSIQWSLDGSPVTGATNLGFSLTNLHLPNHTVTVIVTNLYRSVTSNALVTVIDTLAPVITLNGGNPIYVELGSPFTDPGATADDLCMGVVPVSVAGSVNTNALGTNILTYTATDGNGNTNTAMRTVIVRDTTPPTILWSFTNLLLAANTNCSAAMPDVTGTNFILATDLSGALTISQVPTNTAILPLGTNVVVITVKDSSGNAAYSTNEIVVQDQTPPVFLSQPQSQTNLIGATATFSVAATACTPLAFQWYFNNAAFTAQTNSTLSLSNLNTSAAGGYNVVATASGGSSTSLVAVLTVNLLASTVALAASENPSGFRDNVNFTAATTPTNAIGLIQFLTNGVAFDTEPVVAGAAVSTNISSLPRGTNFVAAVYSGDAGHLPATNSLAQVVTNHPPTATPAFYTNTASLTLIIPIADLATHWSDVDSDAVSLAAVSVSTNGITLTNTGTALVYFNSNNVADQFTCTITDGFGGTNFQTVTIAPAPDTTPLITGVVAGNGSVTLSLGGAPGYAYILETTTNLILPAGWQPFTTNTPGTNGVWQFTDLQATNFPQRFYRLELAP